MDSPQPKPGPLLSKFLAEKDLACEGCGYNLRGVTTLFCPECGMVIPRPPHDQIAKLEGHGYDLLWCPKCRYVLDGITSKTCPECGHTMIRDELPKKARRGTFASVPWPLIFLAALAGMEMVPIFAKYLTSNSRLTPTATVIALAAVLVPLSLAAMFWLGRRRLEEMTLRGFWLLTTLATALGLVCVIGAARLL